MVILDSIWCVCHVKICVRECAQGRGFEIYFVMVLYFGTVEVCW